MKYPKPVNTVENNDEFSSGLMEAFTQWQDGDCFQNTEMPELHLSEAPFDGMDPQSNGAEIEQTSIKKKEAKKPSAKAQLAAKEEYEVLERIFETYDISKIKGIVVQFHRVPEDYEPRRNAIRKKLSETHNESWCYDYIWEYWEAK